MCLSDASRLHLVSKLSPEQKIALRVLVSTAQTSPDDYDIDSLPEVVRKLLNLLGEKQILGVGSVDALFLSQD